MGTQARTGRSNMALHPLKVLLVYFTWGISRDTVLLDCAWSATFRQDCQCKGFPLLANSARAWPVVWIH